MTFRLNKDIREKTNVFEQINQEHIETINYFSDMIINTDNYSPFDLEAIFNKKSYMYSRNGTWDASIILYGSRRTGKSTTLKHVLTEAHKRELIGRVIVITGTKQNEFYDETVPYVSIHPLSRNGIAVLEDLRNKQEVRCARIKAGKPIKYGEKAFQHTIILDDIVHDKKFTRYAEILTECFMTFRHVGCAVIITTQYPKAIPPAIRINADFIFIFKIDSFNEMDCIIKDNLSFINQTSFTSYFLRKMTKNFNSVVVDRTSQTSEDTERISWFLSEDYDELYGTPNERTGQKKLKIQWGHPEWRKDMEKLDKEAKAKELNRQESEMVSGSNNDIFTVNENIITNDISEVLNNIRSNLKFY